MILRLRYRLAPLGDDTWSMTSPGAMAAPFSGTKPLHFVLKQPVL